MTVALLGAFLPAVASPVHAQCQDGHHDAFQGCTLERSETYEWPDGPGPTTCRQKLEARLFYSHLPYLQAKTEVVRHDIESTLGTVEKVQFYIDVMAAVVSAYRVGKGARDLNDHAIDHADIQLLLAETSAVTQFMEDHFNIQHELTATMVQTAIDYASVLVEISVKGALAKVAIPAGLIVAAIDLVPELLGSIALDYLASQLSSYLLGWWYLEDFYRLGGTFDGNGSDAHGLVAEEYGLPSSSDVYAVISRIAEEKNYTSRGFFTWFFNDPSYNLDLAVGFAEDIKERVAIQLETKLTIQPFWMVFTPGELSFGAEAGSTGTLAVSVHNLQSDHLAFCLTARHGTISGSFDGGFVYRAPDGIIDERDPYASTEVVTVTVDNGLQQLQETKSFRLSNHRIFLIIEKDEDSDSSSLSAYDIEFRLDGETGWRNLGERNQRYTIPGSHTIEFRPIDGFLTPPPQSFIAPNQQTRDYAYVTVHFEPTIASTLRGAVRIDLNRPEGRWRIRGESVWRASGNVATGLAFGVYDIEFSSISGWIRPPLLQAIVDRESATVLSAAYRPVPAAKGSLDLALVGNTDFLRSQDTGFWRVQGDDLWRPRSYRYEQLPVGPATVELRRFLGWLTPADQHVSIAAGLNQATVEYLKDPGAEFPVGGWVKNNAVGVEGVTISGFPAGPAVTDRYGRYRVKVPDGWEGTLTASKAGLHFEPANIPVEVLGTYDMNNSFRVVDTPPVPDRTAPVVKVLAPQRNAVGRFGEVLTIRWSAEDESGLLADTKVQYRSVVTNQVWTTVVENLDDVTEYDWTLPDQKPTQTEVRILAEDFSGNVGQAISAPFEVGGGGLCRSPVRAPRLKPWVSTPYDYYVIDWLDVTNAESYVLQEDTHPGFSTPEEFTTLESFRYFRDRTRDTYYYRVKAVGSCGSSPWSAFEDYEVLANKNPILPASPVPANGRRDVSRNLPEVLWDAGDVDGDQVEYDAYFGRSEPLSKICSKTTSQSCDVPGPLLSGTAYFWKVVAIDEHGGRATGPVWTLTTEAVFPDLGIVELTVDNPSPPFEGTVTATARISNRGNDPAEDTFIFFYVESLDGATSYQVKRVFVPALGIGTSTTIETSLTLPPNFLGPHLLLAQVNKYNSVREQNRIDNEARLNVSITDSAAPTVAIVRPLPEQSYRTGFEMKIRWSYDDNEGVDRHDVHYSADAGPWQEIVSGNQSGYVDWLVPEILEGTQVRIKVTVWDHSGNSTAAVSESVAIITGVAPEVTILSPLGGEQLLSENSFELRWEARSPVGIQEVDLEIWQNGFKIGTIAWNISNTGSYVWSPPSHLINQDYHFAVEAAGNNGVDTLVFSPGTFRVVDSFQIPLPWHTPQEVFALPNPPPVPPDAYNFGLPPFWEQGYSQPRLVIDADGIVHCVAFYWEAIRMRKPGANWTYRIGNQGVLYRIYDDGIFGAQSKQIFVTYDESTGVSQDLGIGRLVADSAGTLHLILVIRSLIPHFDGSSPEVVNEEVYHTLRTTGNWSAPVNVSQTANATSDFSTMAITADGTIHVAWREKVSGHSQVYYRSRTSGGSWSPSEVVLDQSFLPYLLADASGGLLLAAQQSSPVSELVLVRYDGGSWSERETLWPGNSGGHTPKLALAPAGDVYAYLARGAGIVVAKVTPGNRQDWTFQFPDAETFTETAMFFDGLGSPHLGYLQQQTVRSVFVERRLYEDGSYGPINFVDSTAGDAGDIRMAFSPTGMAYALWQESLTASYEPILLNHAAFTDDLEAPTVIVLEPSSGQELAGGSSYDITWNVSDNVGVASVNLKISRDEGLSYEAIALAQPNSGRFAWTVPMEEMATALISVEARDANGNVGIGLSQTFSVALPVSEVTLLSPNGSEQLSTDATVTISWEGSQGATVDIEVSLDDGVLWSEIATGLVGESSLSWQVPVANTNRARVRVIADFGDGALRSDASDGPFSIQEQTGPFEPHDPYPPVGAGHVGSDNSLTWSGGHSDNAVAVTYEVEFGIQVDALTSLCTTQATSCSLPSGLAQNAQYYWQVTATDGVVSSSSPIWTFHTGDPSGLLPPENLIAGQGADGSVVLEWNDENAEPGIEHLVEKQWPGTATFQPVAQQSGALLTFEDSAVEGSQDYVYRVRAIRVSKGKALQTSGASNEEHIATDNQLPYSPSSPDPSSGLEVPTLQPTFSWSGGDPDAEDAVTYGLELWPSEVGVESVRSLYPDLVQTTWPLLSPLRTNTLYSWQVAARDDHGAEALGPIWAFETPASVPMSPTDVTAFQVDDRVVLAWRADPRAGEGLFVERRLASTLPFELIEHWTPHESASLQGFAADGEASRRVAEMTSDAVTYRVGVYNEEGYYSYSEPVELVVTPTYPETFTLALSKGGTGQGTVSSMPAGIDCGSDCTEDYPQDTLVTLTAAPEAGSTFTDWSGGCTGTGSCAVTMDAARAVTAGFELVAPEESLTVTITGAGTGTVASSPEGIACGPDCVASFPRGTAVTLTANAGFGSVLAAWNGGGCSDTNPCEVTMDGPRSVTARFELAEYTLTVAKTGAGDGVVTSDPAGIDCGSVCSADFLFGTAATLLAFPDVGSSFGGWHGIACNGIVGCTFILTQPVTVTASFAAACIDTVEAPSGSWQTAAGPADAGNTSPWAIVTSDSSSPSHAWFAADENRVKDQLLELTQAVPVVDGTMFRFRHRFATETAYDGGVLEYSVDGGILWHDVLEGDGGAIPANANRFVDHGYNATLSNCCANPLATLNAWSGDSGGWLEVTVNLSDFADHEVLLRFRMGTDSHIGAVGWWIDDLAFRSLVCPLGLIFQDGFETGDSSQWSRRP